LTFNINTKNNEDLIRIDACDPAVDCELAEQTQLSNGVCKVALSGVYNPPVKVHSGKK
jgi:hypothetical protein